MTTRVITTLEELRPFAAAWNRLADASPSATVFQTFEWLEAWWRAFGVDDRLRVVLRFEGETLAAAAPLMTCDVRAYGRARTGLTFTGGMQTDYCELLARDDAALRGLVRALRSEVAWDLLDLSRIPATSATARVLAEELPGWRSAVTVSDICPAYVFDAEHDGEDVLGKKSIRRHVNSFRKAGTAEVRHLTTAAEVAPELDEFFQQHVDRRSSTGVPSNFLDPRSRRFYGLLPDALAPPGTLLFTVVALDGKAAAYHFGFVHRGRLIWYKPSFAMHLARLSPGEVLLAELFTYCRTHALSELDFTVGDEPFKTRFCTVKRHNVRVRAFRSPAVQAIDHAHRIVRERAKRVKHLRALVRRLRGDA